MLSTNSSQSDESEEERQKLYDDRASYLLTTDEIMRQFVQELDQSQKDEQVAPAIGETEDQHSIPLFEAADEFAV